MDAGVVYARRTVPIDPPLSRRVSCTTNWPNWARNRCPRCSPLLRKADSKEPFRRSRPPVRPRSSPARRRRSVSMLRRTGCAPASTGSRPGPGCDVTLGGTRLRLLRVRDRPDPVEALPGTLLEDGSIACAPGTLELLDVQPPGQEADVLRGLPQRSLDSPGNPRGIDHLMSMTFPNCSGI